MNILVDREKLFMIAAEIGGCANQIEIGDDQKEIIKRLRGLAEKTYVMLGHKPKGK